MTVKEWDQRVCNERAGFLFEHKCDRMPASTCQSCDKPICDKHIRKSEQGDCCISCYGKLSSSSRRDHTETTYDRYPYDPYYYGGYHYDSYGSGNTGSYSELAGDDPNEFTEGDAESLVDDSSADGDFEMDMDES